MILEKYHALGNDYLVYDPALNDMQLNEERVKLLCDRNYGFGSDGILYGPFFENGIPRLRILNPDGSEAEKSGNGIRIFSRYLRDAGYVKESAFRLNTLGGNVNVTFLENEMITVSMGKAVFDSQSIPVTGPGREVVAEAIDFGDFTKTVTCVSMGNPHCVVPMESISKEKAIELGSVIGVAKHFPNRINVQLLKVLDRENIQIEIYERGAGYTLASGSSSCAAASAAYKLGLVDSDIKVHMPGGIIEISIDLEWNVTMTGPVSGIGSYNASDDLIRALNALNAPS
jgi:diaminopimelate epimerase